MTLILPTQSRSHKAKLRLRNIRRNADASDRAMIQARQIGDLFVELAGLNPTAANRAETVKTIADRLGLTADQVNARLYLLRGRKAETRARREAK